LKIRTLIAEDEPHSRERLQEILAEFPDVEIVAQAADGLEAIEQINRLQPDLVFLDVRMPGASGIEVLEKITHRPKVVFVTAYDHYAVRAFEENAVDYVLKPYSRERIGKSLERIRSQRQGMDEKLIESLKKALAGRRYLSRFAVKSGAEMIIIPAEDICYFKAEEKCVLLQTDQKKYFVEATLKELEQNLDPELFLRIHKSVIVAVKRIGKLKRWFHGAILVQLTDSQKTQLKVSRNCLYRLKEKLKF
jgi:DNA-binding LytR/AlgR family response regulator